MNHFSGVSVKLHESRAFPMPGCFNLCSADPAGVCICKVDTIPFMMETQMHTAICVSRFIMCDVGHTYCKRHLWNGDAWIWSSILDFCFHCKKTEWWNWFYANIIAIVCARWLSLKFHAMILFVMPKFVSVNVTGIDYKNPSLNCVRFPI